MKVTNPPFTLMVAVSLYLKYSLSSRVRLFFSLSFFCMDRVDVVREVRGSVRGRTDKKLTSMLVIRTFLSSELADIFKSMGVF